MSKVTAEEFVKAWQQSKSLKEVSQKTGINSASLHSRSSHYRKNNVPLKYFERQRKNDYAALAELAKKLSK